MKPVVLIAAALVAGLASSAQAAMVRGQDPASVLAAMQKAGFTAKLGTDAVGDPMITSVASGTTFHVFFYNCTNHKECATVQFHCAYALGSSPPAELINAWNQGQRFGRAYLDKEQDPVIAMDVDLDDGGVSELLFADNLEFWTTLLGQFEKRIGYRS